MKTLPTDLWSFNGATFDNLIGEETLSAPSKYGVNVDVEKDNSASYSDGAQGVLSCPAFSQGNEERSFGIGGIFRIESGTPGLIHNAGEGLYYDGAAVHFTTIQGGVTYDTKHYIDDGIHTIYGQHSKDQNILMVDGVIVDSVDVAPGTFVSNGSFTVGDGGVVLCDNLFFINHDVNADDIKAAHQANSTTATIETVADIMDGTAFELSTSKLSVIYSLTEDGEFGGLKDGCVVDSGLLTPVEFDGATIDGVYEVALVVGTNTGTPLVATNSFISWTGTSGFTVEAAVGDGAWQACTNNSVIPGVVGTDMDDKDVSVRVTFTAGGTYLDKYIESLYIGVTTDDTLDGSDNLADVAVGPNAYLHGGDNTGMGLGKAWSGGDSLVVQNIDDAYVAVELLVKGGPVSASSETILEKPGGMRVAIQNGNLTFTSASGAVINGFYDTTPTEYSLAEGEVMHIVVFPLSGNQDNLTIGSRSDGSEVFGGRVKYVNIYDTITIAYAATLYALQRQKKKHVITESSSSISFSHANSDVLVYLDTALSSTTGDISSTF